MNFIDILLLLPLIYGFVKGMFNGLFVELSSLISIILGSVLAFKFSWFVEDYLSEVFPDQKGVIGTFSFAITFILVIIGISFLAKFFTKIADFAHLGMINKLLGGLFGLFKFMFIISVILQFFVKLNKNEFLVSNQKIDTSYFFIPVKTISDKVYLVVSDFYIDNKDEIIDKVKE